ncbi:MAG: ribosome maturation factor RimM [Lachnospiraceae bacterium]|nr:ribosome maturation factor RimM [Lachnospiraceae bacterium]
MEDILKVGIITSTHGVKGEVKVFPTTDDVKRFKGLKQVLLENGSEHVPLKIENVKFFKQFAILKFEGLDDMSASERLRGKSLYVSREDAVSLEEDEYYIADLLGMRVIDEEGKELGSIKDVYDGRGANDVYIVETAAKKEILIPAIKDCILSVDVKSMVMKVHLLEGLV